MATDPLDVPPGSLTLEAITDLLKGGGGTPPGGATGDIQLNNGGVFGNANDVFPGAVLEIDATENFIIDLSSGGGGVLLTANALIASTVGNVQFESSDGDVTFQTFSGSVVLQGTEVQIGAVGADVVLSADNGGISIEEAGAILIVANVGDITLNAPHINLVGVQVFANNAAALSGGLVATNLYRTSTGQLMIVF